MLPTERGSATSLFSEQMSSSSWLHLPSSSGSVSMLFPEHLSFFRWRSTPMRDGSAVSRLQEQSNSFRSLRSPSSGLRRGFGGRGRRRRVFDAAPRVRYVLQAVVGEGQRDDLEPHGPDDLVDVEPGAVRQLEFALGVGRRQELVELLHGAPLGLDSRVLPPHCGGRAPLGPGCVLGRGGTLPHLGALPLAASRQGWRHRQHLAAAGRNGRGKALIDQAQRGGRARL